MKATARLAAALHQTRAIILTTFDDDAYVFEGVKADARGYLLKDTPLASPVKRWRARRMGARRRPGRPVEQRGQKSKVGV